MEKRNPFSFFQEVRAEMAKVTWPTRRETVVTTIVVFILVFLMACFFLVVDQVFRWIVAQIFSVG